MDAKNTVLCGRCVFDALKISGDDTDKRTGEEQYATGKVRCSAATDAAAYVAMREHNAAIHGPQSSRLLAAIIGDDEKWHLIDIPEPLIQL